MSLLSNLKGERETLSTRTIRVQMSLVESTIDILKIDLVTRDSRFIVFFTSLDFK